MSNSVYPQMDPSHKQKTTNIKIDSETILITNIKKVITDKRFM